MIYSSPVIHTVTLTELEAGETYEYELADGFHEFRLPAPTYPLRLGLAADVGQTVASCVELKFTARSCHRRDACSMAWRCRFLTDRRIQCTRRTG